MRKLYEKYYTARLWWQPDDRVTPEIIDIEGEYDTEEEATIIARERLPLSYGWEIVVVPHYRKLSNLKLTNTPDGDIMIMISKGKERSNESE